MYSKKVRRLLKKIWLLIFLFSFLIMFLNLNNYKLSEIFNTNPENVNNLKKYKDNIPIATSQASIYEYSSIGTHQNVTEFGQGFFQNNEINVTQNGNASIIVPNNWEANEILCNVTNIYEYDKLWMNETFDSGYDNSYWSNYTSDPFKVDYITFGWYNDSLSSNDSIYMEFINASTDWDDVNSYWNYTYYLDREEIPYKEWSIDFNYRFLTNNNTWLNAGGATKLYCTIEVDGLGTLFNLKKFNTHVNNTWYSCSIEPFSPELYDYDPPGIVNVLFGINWGKNLNFNPTGYLELYFDNISLNLQTIPKPSQINLSITDITNGETKQIINLTRYGKGTISFNNSWIGTIGGSKHKFSFSSNSSGKVYVNTDFFVNATSFSFTTTELAIKGSEFHVENDTKAIWTMYFPVTIPGTYQTNYYFNISKPANWNVTNLIDPYGNDKISQVSETAGLGNTTLVIPNDIAVNGRWKIIAESPNYVLNAMIWKWKYSTWEKNASFEISDKIKINATINNESISNLGDTNASLLVFYPNGSLFSQANQEIPVNPISGFVEFSSFTLGAKNASAGKYTVNIRWNDKNITQVGLFVLNFDVIHNTSLTRAKDQEEFVTSIYTGDIVLIKVNYTNIDMGVGIIGANVNYTIDNKTVITGDMVYYGGGIYIAEIDTYRFKNGIYNVSVSANKTYYKTQYEEKLIQLEITERTIFKADSSFKNVPWGKNVSIYVFYNGSALSYLGISGATISCDWDLGYWYWDDIGSGTYMLELNTTIKQIGTYTLKINASKIGYENQEIYISINIHEIYTNLTYIQPDPVGFKSNVSFLVSYGDIDNGILIPGADIVISNELGAEYWSTDNYFVFMQSLGKYSITFNTSIFGSGGTFGIYVSANKTNYANATAFINIFIDVISTNIDDIFINGQNKTLDKSITIPILSTVNISVKYIEAVIKGNIKFATVEIFGESFSKNFTELSNQYTISIDTRDLDIGVKILTIFAKKEGYALAISDIRITVRSINTTIETESGENVININYGEPYTLRIVLKDSDFGGNIKNATVKYKWEFGEGELLDHNNDGIYEVSFSNIPKGTFLITITAFVGEYYEFESIEITLIVIKSPEGKAETLLFQILTVIAMTVVIGLGGYLIAYQKILKHSKPVRKVLKYRRTLRKKKDPTVNIISRKSAFKNIYARELSKITRFLKGKPIEQKENLGKKVAMRPKIFFKHEEID